MIRMRSKHSSGKKKAGKRRERKLRGGEGGRGEARQGTTYSNSCTRFGVEDVVAGSYDDIEGIGGLSGNKESACRGVLCGRGVE